MKITFIIFLSVNNTKLNIFAVRVLTLAKQTKNIEYFFGLLYLLYVLQFILSANDVFAELPKEKNHDGYDFAFCMQRDFLLSFLNLSLCLAIYGLYTKTNEIIQCKKKEKT